MKRNFTIAMATLAMTGLAHAAPNGGPPGEGDCYNRASNACAKKHPGGTYGGDDSYTKCIDDYLDWCDVNEPAASGIYGVYLSPSWRYSDVSNSIEAVEQGEEEEEAPPSAFRTYQKSQKLQRKNSRRRR